MENPLKGLMHKAPQEIEAGASEIKFQDLPPMVLEHLRSMSARYNSHNDLGLWRANGVYVKDLENGKKEYIIKGHNSIKAATHYQEDLNFIIITENDTIVSSREQ